MARLVPLSDSRLGLEMASMPAPVIHGNTCQRFHMLVICIMKNERHGSTLSSGFTCSSLNQSIIFWNRTALSWHVKRMIIHSTSTDSDPLVFMYNWAQKGWC